MPPVATCGRGEDHQQAALRRVPEELGTSPSGLRMVLPGFRYRAVDASGLVENELCPVMMGRIDAASVQPEPEDAGQTLWGPSGTR